MASTSADQPAEVASKVLRRAQVSKIARALQNRLALANIKVAHGWENLDLNTIEPKVELELKRKRPGSSSNGNHEGGSRSDTSSSVSDRFFPLGGVDSSPLTGPLFSDDIAQQPNSGSSFGNGHRKRVRSSGAGSMLGRPDGMQYAASSSHARVKVRNGSMKATSWKSSYRLPESSPVYHTKHAHFASQHVPRLSFVSETSTVPDGGRSPSLHSEDDDDDLPTLSHYGQRSHNHSHSQMHSSPPRIPRTPSPDIARSARLRSKPFNNTGAGGPKNEDTAVDLLMFLAASPSPANAKSTRNSNNANAQTPRQTAPSTPPPKSTPLPSSMMSTPGGGNSNYLGFGAVTPGMNFNFADYLNVTPSPAQAAWRTPAVGKTPLAAREARRRLNFDGLHPPVGESPRLGMSGEGVKVNGLGMELGGELVSSQ
ncbi:hypothetical protein EJ08DRAFT_670919 [Tothia fuscella]|uniref:Uncharacterized protein n=1 Tax=Tothia fuscella TaxID=1048955 RepID=A0A9P4TXH8_9PEZI|nr:hypothetical protein EJ08DRAFT_670919 [Tothia fuscella]